MDTDSNEDVLYGYAAFNLSTMEDDVIIRSGEEVEVHESGELHWIATADGRRTRSHPWRVIVEAVVPV